MPIRLPNVLLSNALVSVNYTTDKDNSNTEATDLQYGPSTHLPPVLAVPHKSGLDLLVEQELREHLELTRQELVGQVHLRSEAVK